MTYDELVKKLRQHNGWALNETLDEAADAIEELQKPKWIPVTERLPNDFISVQAHIVGAEPFPTVREAYVIGGKWFFPALNEFLPVDKWAMFSEPPKEEA